MIYVAHILNGQFIKFGYTKNEDVSIRLKELQTGNPFEIKLILTTEGTLKQEQGLHAALTMVCSRMRVAMPPNEWYPGRHPFIKQLVKELRHGVGNAIGYAEFQDPAINGKPMEAQNLKKWQKPHSYEPSIKWGENPDAKAMRHEFGMCATSKFEKPMVAHY